MNRYRKVLPAGFLAFFLFTLSACTSVHEPPSGFLGNYSDLQKGKSFKQEYIESGVDLTQYQKVKVNPVDVSRFQNPRNEYSEAEIQQLGTDLQAALEKQLSKKFQVLGSEDRPDRETLVISPALVYATSPERLLNALTFWFIGFQFSKGSAAVEAKLTDGATGKEVAVVAERRKGGGGLSDPKSLLIGGFFRFTHAQGAFNRWGKNFNKMTSQTT